MYPMQMRKSPTTDVHYDMLAINFDALYYTLHLLQDVEPYNNDISSFPGAGDVRFSLRNTTYKNNSIVTLEDIGEGENALLCKTNQTACCRPPYTGGMGIAIGNWFFPNGTRVPSSGAQWDFHRTRGKMVVLLHHRRGGVEGIYRCETPDAMNVMQATYIGVYSASTGEWYMCTSCLVQLAIVLLQ